MSEAIITRRGGGSNIKSIQRFSFEFAVGSISQTVNIATINLNAAVIRNVTLYPNNLNITADEFKAYLRFNSNSQVYIRRHAGTTYSLLVSFDVVEYKNIKSIQTISFSTTNLTITKAISSVNVNKAELAYTNSISLVTTSIGSEFAGNITTDVLLTFAGRSGENKSGTAFVIEYK